MRDRGLALLGDDQPPALGLRADLGERQCDRARFALRDAVENREIALFDLPLLKGPAKPAQRLGIARQQQTARSVGVEPVHRYGGALEAEPELVELICQRRTAAARRVEWQTGRLVQDRRSTRLNS